MTTAQLTIANKDLEMSDVKVIENVVDVRFGDTHVLVYLDDGTLAAYRTDCVVSLVTTED